MTASAMSAYIGPRTASQRREFDANDEDEIPAQLRTFVEQDDTKSYLPGPCLITEEWDDPVCGIDGNTYGNPSEAACKLVVSDLLNAKITRVKLGDPAGSQLPHLSFQIRHL